MPVCTHRVLYLYGIQPAVKDLKNKAMEIFTLLALGALFLQILFARHTLERRFDMLERELAQLKRLLKETAGLPKEQKEPAETLPKAPEEAAEAISAPIYKEVKEEVIPSEPLVEIPVQPAFEPVEEQLSMAAEPINEKAEQSVEPLTAEPAAMVQQSPAVQQTLSTDSEAPQSVAIEAAEKQKEPTSVSIGRTSPIRRIDQNHVSRDFLSHLDDRLFRRNGCHRLVGLRPQ